MNSSTPEFIKGETKIEIGVLHTKNKGFMANQKKDNFFVRMNSYISECYKELRYKVTWPTKKELSSSAVLVLVASLVMSLFIFLVDKAFEFIVTGIYRILI